MELLFFTGPGKTLSPKGLAFPQGRLSGAPGRAQAGHIAADGSAGLESLTPSCNEKYLGSAWPSITAVFIRIEKNLKERHETRW